MISWRGSIEIGVVEWDPETTELPPCAMNLHSGSWIMTSSGIVHNGIRVVEMYGIDLNELEEGNSLGVMRTSNVSYKLLFYIHTYIYVILEQD